MLDQKQHKALKEEIINKFGHSFIVVERVKNSNATYIIRSYR